MTSDSSRVKRHPGWQSLAGVQNTPSAHPTLIPRVAIYYCLLVVLLFIAGPWPSQPQPSGCMRQLLSAVWGAWLQDAAAHCVTAPDGGSL